MPPSAVLSAFIVGKTRKNGRQFNRYTVFQLRCDGLLFISRREIHHKHGHVGGIDARNSSRRFPNNRCRAEEVCLPDAWRALSVRVPALSNLRSGRRFPPFRGYLSDSPQILRNKRGSLLRESPCGAYPHTTDCRAARRSRIFARIRPLPFAGRVLRTL